MSRLQLHFKPQSVCQICVTVFLLIANASLSADYYVATNGTGTGVGSWENATNSLQGAIVAAPAGSIVWVSNGVYRADDNVGDYIGTNVLYINNKAMELRAWSGNPADTIIDGGGSNRCLATRLVGADKLAVIDGFTLTNGYGYRRGGGIIVYGDNASTTIVRNCIIAGNVTDNPVGATDTNPGGGGIYCYPTSGDSGFKLIVSNCVVRGNRARDSTGGGLRLRVSADVIDCKIISNQSHGAGAGIYAQPVTTAQVKVDRCVISGNTTSGNAAGMYLSVAAAGLVDIYNTLICSNTATLNGGGIYVTGNYYLRNCTVSANTANTAGGVFYHSGSVGSNYNSIIYYNVGNDMSLSGNYVFENCCTPSSAIGGSNITEPPMFASDGNYRLQNGSPCINAGKNDLSWMTGALDLDGNPRIDRISRIVDIGCFEYMASGTFFYIK